MATSIRPSGRSKQWLFQFAKGDPIDHIGPGYSQPWKSRKEMKAGDEIVLWKPGKEAGVFGLGKILSDPVNRPFFGQGQSVRWECNYKSRSILLRHELRDLNDADLNRLLAIRGFLKAGVERISESQWQRINQHLRKKNEFPSSRSEDHICEKISVEQMLKERTKSQQKAVTRSIFLRERGLLRSYIAHMKVKGIQFESRRMRSAGETNFIRCDLYEPKRGVLFEAKGFTTREAIRMAIGELLDYGRFLKPIPSLAVL
jgi:hypothetical protein